MMNLTTSLTVVDSQDCYKDARIIKTKETNLSREDVQSKLLLFEEAVRGLFPESRINWDFKCNSNDEHCLDVRIF